MTKTKRPKDRPGTPFPTMADALHQQGDWLWIPLRQEWRAVSAKKPEEVVRQQFIRFLVDDLAYSLDQIDQERRTQHGHRSPRADIVVWASAADKAAGRTPGPGHRMQDRGIKIQVGDYYQGESYARAVGCELFVPQHPPDGRFQARPGHPGECRINELPKASDWGDAKRIEAIRTAPAPSAARSFRTCCSSATASCATCTRWSRAAPSTPSRRCCSSRCTSSAPASGARSPRTTSTSATPSRLPTDKPVHEQLFDQTKQHYEADEIFAKGDKLDISEGDLPAHGQGTHAVQPVRHRR